MHISFTQLDVLLIIPLATAVMGYRRILYRMLPGESKDKVYYGYSCVVWGQVILIRLFEGYSNLDLALDYLFFTYYLYKWWISGGGDGVKKILQSLAPKTPIVVQ